MYKNIYFQKTMKRNILGFMEKKIEISGGGLLLAPLTFFYDIWNHVITCVQKL